VRDLVVDFVRCWSEKAEIGVGRFIPWLGVTASKFFEWLRHEAACVIVRRAPLDRTCHPIGSTLRGVAFRKRIV